MASAAELRDQFRALPKQLREDHQQFGIRVWRGLSWLERAEEMGADDLEGRFVSTWIAFNALYGRLDDNNRPWGDRESQGAFLAQIWRLDHRGRLSRVMHKRQLQILKLIENKFLTIRFWEHGESASHQVKKELRKALACFGTPKMLFVVRLLFERLYVMRNQMLHGASTKGSKLNRRMLQSSGTTLLELLPLMLTIMIKDGVEEDWGRVCFHRLEYVSTAGRSLAPRLVTLHGPVQY